MIRIQSLNSNRGLERKVGFFRLGGAMHATCICPFSGLITVDGRTCGVLHLKVLKTYVVV